jgi:osmotically-inducible protein OsmY
LLLEPRIGYANLLIGGRSFAAHTLFVAQPEGPTMKSNKDIQHNVEAELRWNPKIDGTYIAVKVNDGVVALTGFVRSALGVTRVKSELSVRT